MKRLLYLLCIVLICGLAACQSPSETPPAAETAVPEESAKDTPAPVEEEKESEQANENESESQPVDVRVGVLKGPTAMGMVKLMDEADNGEIKSNNFSFSIAAAIDEITPKIVQGGIDIAAVPANLASVLYNNTDGQVQVIAVNTLGVLYIVESGESIKSVEDLHGKTIYASGKGATPEYALNYILSANGVEDAIIEWKSEHSECAAVLAASKNAIAMLPQPFVSIAQNTNPNIRIALDLTEEWDALQQSSDKPGALITGVVVARTDFAAQNPEAVSDFLDRYSVSVSYVNNNIEDASALIGKYDIVPAPIAQKAIPYCNIVFIEGSEMKEKLSGYLEVLLEQNPKSIGGALPDDEFYYGR